MTGIELDRMTFWLDRVAFWAVMSIPLLLLHAHGIAEVAIAITDVCFLARCALRRDWAWLRTPWLWAAGLWWGWIVICSLPVPVLGLGAGGTKSLVQAVVLVRFLVFMSCLEHDVLRPAIARKWMFGMVAASALWIAVNAVVQNFFGYNLLGYPRSLDGELTGPFRKPRAGPAMTRILLPAILPPAVWLLARRRTGAAIGGYALLLLGVVIMVLIGQRMPLITAVFALVVVAFLMPRLRRAVLVAAVAGGVLVAASPAVAPSAYYRLVEKFSDQMEHFATSPYGVLYYRAGQVGMAHPIAGMGFGGFGTGCPQAGHFPPLPGIRAPSGLFEHMCWDHPHNYYLEELDNGGFIGLALFAATGVAWLVALGRGLWRDPAPIRVALFATVFVALWPIQSTTAFTSMPVGGWLFLLLGWGLAEARWRGAERGVETAGSAGILAYPQSQPAVGPAD